MGKFINPFTDMGFKLIFGQDPARLPAAATVHEGAGRLSEHL